MLRSLRFQLPAFFLLGAVIAGLVSAVIALRLFQSYAQTRAREQAYAELAREARGITELYQQRAGLKLLSAKNLERATGDNIFYVGLDPFPGQGPAFQRLPVKGAALKKVRVSHPVRIEFQRAGKQRLLGVARPLKIGSQTFGWIVVAKPKTVLNQHWFALIERLLIAFAGGLARRRRLRVVPLAPDHEPCARALAGRRPGLTRALRRGGARRFPAAARSASSPIVSVRWRRGSPRRRSSSATS